MKLRRLILFCGLAMIGWGAHADLSLSATYVSFFDVEVGGYGPTQNIYIRNIGDDSVNVGVSDSCDSDYQIYSYCGRIGAGQSCSLSIQFNPTQAGYSSCDIYLSDGRRQYSISVRGEGVER